MRSDTSDTIGQTQPNIARAHAALAMAEQDDTCHTIREDAIRAIGYARMGAAENPREAAKIARHAGAEAMRAAHSAEMAGPEEGAESAHASREIARYARAVANAIEGSADLQLWDDLLAYDARAAQIERIRVAIRDDAALFARMQDAREPIRMLITATCPEVPDGSEEYHALIDQLEAQDWWGAAR